MQKLTVFLAFFDGDFFHNPTVENPDNYGQWLSTNNVNLKQQKF
jgi:hypothetical protein